MNKSTLAIILSKLKPFENPKVQLEQYTTDSEIAANILWNAYMLKDISENIVSDYGSGTGILGIGALELGAKKVFLIEKDKDVLNILKENLKEYRNYKLINSEISEFNEKSDVVIMNPPFGVKNRKADKVFVEKAFNHSKIIYYIGKIESEKFINSISKDYNRCITHHWKYILTLKKTMFFHTKRKKDIAIGCWRIK